jgi:predicted transcriptional regulator
MARRKPTNPAPGELEILKIVWERGPCTIRQVWEVLNKQRKRHYMSTKSQFDAMTLKGWLKRKRQGRAYLYRANVAQEKASGEILQDLLGRVFEGSASALLVRLLDQAKPSLEEMQEIRKTVDDYFERQGEN